MDRNFVSRRSRLRALPWATVFALLSAPIARAEPIQLSLPIDCVVGRTCAIQNYVDHDPSANAHDFTCGTLTYDGHDGTDFRLRTTAAQREGVNVLAAAEGNVLRARDGMADISQSTSQPASVAGRECGNGIVVAHRDGWQTQYCHLAKGSVRVKPGERVTSGQPIGKVGLSGRTEFPHVHFAVRYQGRIVDPFAYGGPPDTCNGGISLWDPSLRDALTYRPRMILNAGFAQQAVTNEMIELEDVGPNSKWTDAPVLGAFVRTVGLKAKDVQKLTIVAPDGQTFATYIASPLDRDKAQISQFVGKRRTAVSWPQGTYRARYSVEHDAHQVLEWVFELSF